MIETRETTVTLDGVDLLVEYDFYPGSRGAREQGSGVQLEPDEPASIEITKVSLSPKVYLESIDLTELLEIRMDDIEQKIYTYEDI